MLANAAPREWHVVPQECFEAISEAARAYDDTELIFLRVNAD